MKKSFKQTLLSRVLACSSLLVLTGPTVAQGLTTTKVNANTTDTSTLTLSSNEVADDTTSAQMTSNSMQNGTGITNQSSALTTDQMKEKQNETATLEKTEADGTEISSAQVEEEEVKSDSQVTSETLPSSKSLDEQKDAQSIANENNLSRPISVAPTQLAANVNIDEINFPDPILREWIKNNVAGGGDVLTDQMINSVTSINISNTGVTDLTGIQFFTKLTNLSAVNNNISYINPIWFPSLKTLYIMNNKLPYLPGNFNTSQNVPQYSSGEAIWNPTRQRWEYDPAQFQGLDKTRFNDTLYSGTTNHAWAWDSVNQVMYRTDRQNFPTYDFIYGYKGDSGNVIGGYRAVVTFSGIVTAKYVDENGVSISPDVVLSGYTGNGFVTEAKNISGYDLVSTQGTTSGVFSTTDHNITYTYTPKYESEIETKSVKRTIHYIYEDGTKAADDMTGVVTFTRTATKNLATGEVTYTDWVAKDADTTFEAVTSPSIDNYTADKATVAEVTGLTATDKDSEVTVTYSPKLETTTENKKVNQTIHYVYEDGTKAADDATDTVSFTRVATKNLATGEVTYSDWKAVDDDTTFEDVYNPAIDHCTADKDCIDETAGLTADSQDLEFTVTYVANITATEESKTVERTIHYVYEDGKKAADDKVDTVTFTRTAHTNELTGDVTYTDWVATDDDTTFDAVTSPELKNYTADKKVVEEVTGLTATSKDSEVTVTYVKEKATTPPTTPSSTPITPSSSTPTEKGKTVTTGTRKQTVKVTTSPVEKVTKHFMNLPTTGDKVGAAATILGVAVIAGVAILGALRLKRKSK